MMVMMSKCIGSVKSISLQEPTKKKPLFCSELLFFANCTLKNTTVVSRNFPLSRSTENRPLGTDKHQKTNLLLQPEQLQNAPKISCATSLREREGDLRMRSLFASNHQSSRTDTTKSCPNIATDQIPIPGPTSTPLSEALVSSVRVSLLVWSPVCCIFWQAFVVVRSSSGEDEAVSVW